MKTEIIAIFDIGKTNKKVLHFDKNLKLLKLSEEKFAEVIDDDGFPCDDFNKIEKWIIATVQNLATSSEYDLKGVNFSSYGASLVYLDKDGNRLTPVYNYLKPMPENILEEFYETHGGIDEFSRKTASPALGMLNSGLQILWLKKSKPAIFKNVTTILHLPQYLSYILSKNICSDYTSIGCHTALWDYDNKHYHSWLKSENIHLPEPVLNNTIMQIQIENKSIAAGIGIHDSSSSLVPYLKANTSNFILISTGTWCIFMNPFNNEPLTIEQLKKDSLCYLSTNQKQVKSSRLFMGHIHDVNVERISRHFEVEPNAYKLIKADISLIKSLNNKKFFFKNGYEADYIDTIDLSVFNSFEEAYHKLVIDLTLVAAESMKLILAANDNTETVFISGGFSRNEIFVIYLASLFPSKKFYTTEVDNSSAMGAAMIVCENIFGCKEPQIDLRLNLISALNLS